MATYPSLLPLLPHVYLEIKQHVASSTSAACTSKLLCSRNSYYVIWQRCTYILCIPTRTCTIIFCRFCLFSPNWLSVSWWTCGVEWETQLQRRWQQRGIRFWSCLNNKKEIQFLFFPHPYSTTNTPIFFSRDIILL